jgi:gluconolactonase
MKHISRFLLFAVICLHAGFSRAAFLTIEDTPVNANHSSAVVADGAKPQLISRQFTFTEGPAVDKYGNVYFTDQPNDKIWKYSTDGKLSVFFSGAGRANGLYFDRNSNLLSCSDLNNQLWSISPDKKVKVLLSGYKGMRFNGPNDLWVDRNGGIYFTDPNYKRDYWTSNIPQLKEERVYYLPKGKKVPIIVDSTLIKPNGIVGTPDGKTLFVADIQGNKTYKFDINADGTLANRRVFVNQGSDGMTIDNQGNIYLSGMGITVYNKEGIKIEHIDIPEKWTANVCFGGKNKDKLFITASEGIYTVDMKVKGVE